MVIQIQIEVICKLTGMLNYWVIAGVRKLKYRLFVYAVRERRGYGLI